MPVSAAQSDEGPERSRSSRTLEQNGAARLDRQNRKETLFILWMNRIHYRRASAPSWCDADGTQAIDQKEG